MGTIQVTTTRFGTISVEESLVIRFIEPILGFDGLQRFIILDHSENSPFKWLQSLEEPDLAFVITNPKLFGIEYEFILPQPIADKLAIVSADDALVVTIVNIPQGNPGKMTANLLGPIVINQANKSAMQVVLSDSEFSTKTRLIPDDMLEKQSSTSIAADKGE
jgi:flagellar assembly factor FliW